MHTPDTYYELELLRKTAGGDEAAFTELFHLFTPRLYAYLLKLTKDDQLAREMVQETFFNVWVKRNALAGVNNASAYIFRIAANLTINYFNHTAVVRKVHDTMLAENSESMSDFTEERMEAKDKVLYLREAIDMLPEKRREVFLMSREKGMSHAEIAEKMGISVNTVKNQMVSALKFIQEHINRRTGLSIAVITLLLQF